MVVDQSQNHIYACLGSTIKIPIVEIQNGYLTENK